jgi:hypothetical protein
MRRLFEASVMSETAYSDAGDMTEVEESEDLWVCSQSCVPLTLTARARLSLDASGLNMKAGHCNSQGYLCQVGTGSQELHSGRWWIPRAFWDPLYSLSIKIYAMPGEDETCGDEGDANVENYDAKNGDDGGAVGDENEEQENNTVEAEEEQQMQATASGVRIQDVVIDIAEEAVANAGL